MPTVSHVFRRGAVYYWRRRIIGVPGGESGSVVVVSLDTKDQGVARRRGAALTHMSEQLFEEIRLAHLSPDAARAILIAAALEQSDLLARAATADRALSEPEPMSGARADRVVGAVYKLLAERGTSARLDADSAAFLARCGLPTEEAFQVQTTLDVFRRQGLVPAPEWKLRKLLAEHAPDVEPSAVVLAETAHAFYRGKAAACLDTDGRWGDTTSDDVELMRAARRNRAASAPSTAKPTGSAPPPPPAVPTASTDLEPAADLATKVSPALVVEGSAQDPDIPKTITGLAAKLAATQQQLGGWDEKTAGQHISVARLLMRVVQHDDFARLRQCDFAKYRDVLLGLPKSYGKSSKDAQRSVVELLARGQALPPEKRGLIAPTINRHLTQLGNILKSATSYGLRAAEAIDLSGLRAKEGERDRDQRPPMTLDDIRAILKGAPWHGCLSEAKRLEPGQMVIHDSLYWAPPIAIYSMMRREEICGLMIVDVHFDARVPYFDVVRNKYRRLKNAQSKRKIPIHPELLRLGLRAYVEAIAALRYDLLFPELLPASGKARLGNQFHRDWLPLLTHTAPVAVEEGKVFHSIRHFGNQQLVEAAVISDWRQDIMGHKGKSEAEERYRDDVALRNKLRALKKLPNVTAQLQAFPILLRENVVKKIGRKPRPTKREVRVSAPASSS